MLDEYREKIQNIDKEIFNLLEDRFILTNKVGLYKKDNNLNIENLEVERKIIKNAQSNFKNLDPFFVEKLYNIIFNESKKKQRELNKNI